MEMQHSVPFLDRLIVLPNSGECIRVRVDHVNQSGAWESSPAYSSEVPPGNHHHNGSMVIGGQVSWGVSDWDTRVRWEWWQSPPLGSVHTWHGDHWPLTSTGPGFVTLSRRGLTSLLVTTWQWFHSPNWCLDNVDCQWADSSPSASFLNVIINVHCVKSLENNSLSWWTCLQIF